MSDDNSPFTIEELSEDLRVSDVNLTPFNRRLLATLLHLLEDQRFLRDAQQLTNGVLTDHDERVTQLHTQIGRLAGDVANTTDLARGRTS